MDRMDQRTAALQQAALEQLRIERAASNLSYTEIARRVEVSEKTVRRYFAGERDIPMPTLLQMLEAMGVSVQAFWERSVARIA